MGVRCHKKCSFVMLFDSKKIVAENMKSSKFENFCYDFVG